MATGLVLSTYNIPNGDVQYTVGDSIVYASCYNNTGATVFMPSNPLIGRMLLVKRLNGGVTVNGNGHNFLGVALQVHLRLV